MNIDAIRSIIRDEILNDPDFEIEAAQDLLLSEILNSLRVTLLITRLEDSYGVEIPPEDVTLENFGTLESIAAYVQTLLDSGD
ncbi:MAG: acyl carrier protein [Woeseiaceae bacterium]|nr:acyl carrier protein [Woeseiaceae bacterium]